MNQDIGFQIIQYLRKNTTKVIILYDKKKITSKELLIGCSNFKKIINKDSIKNFLPLVSTLEIQIFAFLASLLTNKAIYMIDSELSLFKKISLIKKNKPDLIIKERNWKINIFSKLFKSTKLFFNNNEKKYLDEIKNYFSPKNDFNQFMSYSSGSTGEAKLIKRSRFFINQKFNSLKNLFQKIIGTKQSCILTNQLNIIFILITLGHQVILYSPKMKTNLPPEVDTVIGSTYLIEVIINNKIDCNNIILGGSPIYNKMIKRLKNIYPFSNLYNVYGCTECEPISYNFIKNLPDENTIGTCVGKPIHPVLIDDNTQEILVSGPNVNPQSPNIIIKNGVKYLATGDAGYLSPDGNLYLLGRLEWKSQQWNIPIENKLLSQFPQLKKVFLLMELFTLVPKTLVLN